MVQKLTVTRISKKEGQNQATGKEWTKFGILTKEYGEKWLGSFANQWNQKKLDDMKAGDEIVVVVDKDKTGQFLNFRFATGTDLLDARVTAIEKRLGITAEEPQVVAEPDLNDF